MSVLVARSGFFGSLSSGGIPMATHHVAVPFSQFAFSAFTMRVQWTLDEIPSSEIQFAGAGAVGSGNGWCMAADQTSSSTYIASDTSAPPGGTLIIDGVIQTGTRVDVHAALADQEEHSVEVVWLALQLVYQWGRYPSDPGPYDLRAGTMRDLYLDPGNTGTWQHHYPLTSVTDTRDLIGSSSISIVAD